MRFSSAIAIAAVAFALALPAAARTGYVEDGASLFGAGTVANLNREIGDFERQTGKEIVVVSEPSLGGKTLKQASEDTFAKQQVNGVLFYFAQAEKQDSVSGDTASKAFFPPGSFQKIHDAMRGYFRTGDFDQGITTGVNLVLDQYRGHQRSALGTQSVAATHRSSAGGANGAPGASFGGGMSLIWLAIILFAGFLIIRGIFRALSGPRVLPPGYGGPGAPGPGVPGYGPGYYGGGGGFFSGLLGGLGGAWLGSELFGGNRGMTMGEQGTTADMSGGAGSADASGWQSDPGQIDSGDSGGGSFGDTGGGFGDSGGGFGGGDSGGGW